LKFCQLIVSLSLILFQFKLTKLKLEVLKSVTISVEKKDMNTDKLAVNLQNFARVRLQLKIAFIIRPEGPFVYLF